MVPPSGFKIFFYAIVAENDTNDDHLGLPFQHFERFNELEQVMILPITCPMLRTEGRFVKDKPSKERNCWNK